MRVSVIFLAASAGLVAAQTDPTGQCIQTCFAKVGQDNLNSSDIKTCQSLTDGLQQLLCLCRSTPLVDAFTTCAGETCPEFAAQVNGKAICQSSQTGTLDPSSSAAAASVVDAGPSNTADEADASPSNTASVAGAGPASNTAGAVGPSNTASSAGAANTNNGAPAPAPTSGGTDAGNGAGTQRVEMLNFVFGCAAVVLAGGWLV